MKGVLLAAGAGSRLAHYHQGIPKVLLPVTRRTIIDYTLEAFGQVGVTELAIVIGYQGHLIRDWVGDGSRYALEVEYIFNPDYEWGNAISLHTARSFAQGEPILLAMADHMVSPRLLAALTNWDGKASALAVDFDFSIRDAEEGTRVLVEEHGSIVSIGKGLADWNGIDTGVFKFAPDIFGAIDKEVSVGSKRQHELSHAITRLIEEGGSLQACDVSGSFWHDVDTWEDLQYVRKVISGYEE